MIFEMIKNVSKVINNGLWLVEVFISLSNTNKQLLLDSFLQEVTAPVVSKQVQTIPENNFLLSGIFWKLTSSLYYIILYYESQFIECKACMSFLDLELFPFSHFTFFPFKEVISSFLQVTPLIFRFPSCTNQHLLQYKVKYDANGKAVVGEGGA